MSKRFVYAFVLIVLGGVFSACFQRPLWGDTKDQDSVFVIGELADFPVGTVKALPEHRVIIFSDQEGIYAISSRCTHKGCLVSFKKEKGFFACPCHGAQFSKDGVVARGPARQDLSWFAVSLNDQKKLIVDKSKIVPVGTKFLVKDTP